ncbi:Regulator of competence-specific genes [Thalassovita gelatinovora]|uniref:Regulator of competence-specific genes n=1 Tax=Thalassovita gelatinovora TaxID=53501 RepID=A0A0P1FKJ7_THAGE|nr:TfoX/Sxy family DNA transformation protein [Thalassovita gelatinovora]QIZ79046.1 competence protein TfoX [Thalassovita gelatinovora]CUH68636.1 Regulator of competence-specific genes [Thalassovita gelatinovora]SEQ55871.1 TfoX C-terminal domain-containing protein [Thalassovita gelatinovora]
MSPVSSIRNLGPAVEQACTRAGIQSAEGLRALGADAAYTRLISSGSRPHFIGYCALVMGLQGRPWNDCQGAEKDALRARFDAIKAAATPDHPPQSEIERVLDEIGVVEKRPGKTKNAP